MAGKRRGKRGRRKPGDDVQDNKQRGQNGGVSSRVPSLLDPPDIIPSPSNYAASSSRRVENIHVDNADRSDPPEDDYEDDNDDAISTSYSYSSDAESDYEDDYHRHYEQHRANHTHDNQQQHEYNDEQQHWSNETEVVEQYHQTRAHHVQPQQNRRQQKCNNNNTDHTFTQFNIQPLKSKPQHNQDVDDEEDDDSYQSTNSKGNDIESQPLFTSNFNTATDSYTNQHVKGKDYGVDYIQSRAERREQERMQQMEIETMRELQKESKWWWEDDDDEEWDEIDFDRKQSSYFKCKRRGVKYTVVLVVTFTIAIAYHHQRNNKISSSKRHTNNINSVKESNYTGSTPSSRWGHRTNDTFAFTKTTLEEKAQELEKWEDFEMEVANVLADSRPEWDIHSKSGVLDDNNGTDDGDGDEDGYTNHYIQYFDKTTQNYYYFHKETNTTTWDKPEINKGVILLGITYGTGKEYIVEDGNLVKESDDESDEMDEDEIIFGEESADLTVVNLVNNTAILSNDIEEDDDSKFDEQKVFDQYKDTMWRWNHPYRTPIETKWSGGIDTPVLFRIPLSGATTIETIFTHCYGMIVAGTTGSTKDGKEVLHRNISEYLSVITLDDGSHYLNIDISTKEGIESAKKAGLGQSGVADVILTRYIYNAAELFRDTGHTGRCFTILRHPVTRAAALFHSLKRNGVEAVANMSILDYAKSSVSEDNWMTRIITNTMSGKLTQHHLQVAKEVIGRKCLVGFIDKDFKESMERFTKFFYWETIHSINKHHIAGTIATGRDIEEKRACARKYISSGTNRHQYTRLDPKSEAWKLLKAKNMFDIDIYNYAEALYYKQSIVYEDNSGEDRI